MTTQAIELVNRLFIFTHKTTGKSALRRVVRKETDAETKEVLVFMSLPEDPAGAVFTEPYDYLKSAYKIRPFTGVEPLPRTVFFDSAGKWGTEQIALAASSLEAFTIAVLDECTAGGEYRYSLPDAETLNDWYQDYVVVSKWFDAAIAEL